MVRENKAAWKAQYFLKVVELFDEFPKYFIVGADNVGSKQMQNIRTSLRGLGVVLIGKNIMMRKAIRGHLENNAQVEKLLPHIKGNVGLVFTKGDLAEVRDKFLESKVLALLPHCPSLFVGLGPEKTSFFRPRFPRVYDSRSIFSPEILHIKLEGLHAKCQAGVANLAAVSLAIGYSTIASAPHSVTNGVKNLLAIAAATEVEFKEAATIKDFIKDPNKFAAAAAASAPAASAGAAAEKKEVAETEESESEEDDNMGFGLFD